MLRSHSSSFLLLALALPLAFALAFAARAARRLGLGFTSLGRTVLTGSGNMWETHCFGGNSPGLIRPSIPKASTALGPVQFEFVFVWHSSLRAGLGSGILIELGQLAFRPWKKCF